MTSLPAGAAWLDVQGAQNREHFDRGIPRYVAEQARALVAGHPDALAGLGLNASRPLTGNLGWLLGSERLHWSGLRPRAPRPLPRLFHAMSPFELDRSLDELWPAWARRPEVATAVTLFDLIPLVFPEHYLRDPALRARYLARCDFVRGADQVLAISRRTADDAVERLGVPAERVTVIDAGVSNHFADAFGSRAEAQRIVDGRVPGLRSGFMLYVAGIEFRKNIERLIEAYGLTLPAFRRRHPLVITCRMEPEVEAALRGHAAHHGLARDELVLTNYVSDAELAALYRTCELFVFPSFYEGSGLPILEAMACGIPVAAANASTSPEILGDLEGTFDPFDAADIARVLQATLADPATMERLRERSRERVRGYTWERVAERSVAGFAAALERRGRGRVGAGGRARARIAAYSPWPPDRSGIAAYNLRLFAALGRRADVDVVAGGPAASYVTPQEPGVSLVHRDDVRWRAPLRGHERLLYMMGNSDFHGYVYEALKARAGAVVAHDVRLTGFYGWYSGHERPSDPASRLGERIDAMYSSRLGEGSFATGPPSPEQQSALGIYMTQEIQEYAEQILVHSRHAADILRLDRVPDRRVDAEIAVLEPAYPVQAKRPFRAPDPAAPVLVTFGVVSSVKHPQLLLEAFALLAADRPGARLVFAGGGDAPELARWRGLAAALEVGERVEFTGHVDGAAWSELFARADLAVQLRQLSNGEASGAVIELLAEGIPTAVSDAGWFAELPDDAVVKVPAEATAPVLARVLAGTLDDPHALEGIGEAAHAHARASSVGRVAERYLEWLELAC